MMITIIQNKVKQCCLPTPDRVARPTQTCFRSHSAKRLNFYRNENCVLYVTTWLEDKIAEDLNVDWDENNSVKNEKTDNGMFIIRNSFCIKLIHLLPSLSMRNKRQQATVHTMSQLLSVNSSTEFWTLPTYCRFYNLSPNIKDLFQLR